MKLINLLFLIFSLPLFALDLIQIDVGNAITFKGILNMPSTSYVHISGHGTHMALALYDELIKQKSKPVVAEQIAWHYFEPDMGKTIRKALTLALEKSPLVMSLSYGGKLKDSIEEEVLLKHMKNDTVIVAAAGNNGGGIQYYPANYNNPCIINVGTLINGKKAEYSNYAHVWLEYNKKDLTGTSASTARMAGIILQFRRKYPKLSCAEIVLHVRMLYRLYK